MKPRPRPFRGIGSARKTRRTLERGGTGPAAELNETLGNWPRVKITPMFGRWGYFVGPRLFACFPLSGSGSGRRTSAGPSPPAARRTGA
jgi:hypothetical protein